MPALSHLKSGFPPPFHETRVPQTQNLVNCVEDNLTQAPCDKLIQSESDYLNWPMLPGLAPEINYCPQLSQYNGGWSTDSRNNNRNQV